MRKGLLTATFILFMVSAAAGQSASISNVNPASKSVTVGQSFSVDVSYSTSSVNSCTLEVISSSLPANWESSGQINVQTTGGSTSTVRSPQISTSGSEAEADISLRLSCSSSTVSPTSSSSFHVTATNPPFLEGNRETTKSVNVSSGETYTVRFSVSNTGSSATQSAKAVIRSPNGYDHPSTISLKEAGQEDGTIRAGKSTGTSSFDITATNNPERGDLTVELTSSEIGVTDSFKVDLLAPVQESDDSGNEDSSGNEGGFGGLPPSTPTTNPGNNESKASNQSKRPNFLEEISPGEKGEVEFNRSVSSVAVNVNTPVQNIEINVDTEEGKPTDVENPGREVYRYMDISSNISSESLETAEIDFSVAKNWIASRNATKSEVVLMRHEGNWSELNTTVAGENSTHINYRAETPGFSYFAVSTTEGEDQTGNDQTENTPDTGEGSLMPLTLLVIVLATAGLLGYYYREDLPVVGLESRSRRKLAKTSDKAKKEISMNTVDDEEEIYKLLEEAENLHNQERYREALHTLEDIERKL